MSGAHLERRQRFYMDVESALKRIKKSLSSRRKPDPKILAIWIKENLQPMTRETYDEIALLFLRAYGLDQEALSSLLARPRAGLTQYVDTLSTLIDDIGLKGWLRDYVELTRNMEPPTAFHFWSGLTILGASLHRQCYVDQGYYRIWPAVQTIIVGPSQRVKKGTATAYAVRIGERSGRIHRLMDEGTTEALKTELSARSRQGAATGLIYSAELGTLLGEKDYNKDMVQVLTDLFDSRTGMQRKTQARGSEYIRDIAVSFLGCTNERWARGALPPSVYEGGFMARVLLVQQLGTDRIFPTPTLPSQELEDEVIEWLKRTQFVGGRALMTATATKFYVEKYKWMKENWPEDERMSPFWSRIPDHMLRLGMLLSISSDVSQRDGIEVTQQHMVQADALLSWILEGLPRLYSMLGMNEYGDNALHVVDYLYRRGGSASNAELSRNVLRHMSKRALRECLEMLLDAKIVMRPRRTAPDGTEVYVLLQGPEDL